MSRVRSLAVLLLVLAISSELASSANAYKTVYDAVKFNRRKGLGVLWEALYAADPAIRKALRDPKLKATVFAPTDDAFVRLLKTLHVSKRELLHNTELLNKVLLYHVVGGASVKSTDLKPKQTVQTLLEGSSGTLDIRKFSTGAVRVITTSGVGGSAQVTTADIRGGAATIHLVNRVLVPK